jgi:large subunit ribosomal protein L1
MAEDTTTSTTDPAAAAKPAVTKKPAAKKVAVKIEGEPAIKKTPAKPAAKTPAKKSSAKKAPAISSPHGKKYREAAEKIEADKQYSLAEAVELVQQTSTTKFDGTVEIHIRLGIDARQAEQSVRGTVKLPAGSGKDVKILAFVPAAKQADAKKAGADFVSDEATLKKVQDGWTGFDVSVATPDQMAEVGKLGKVLGPKGLMPNPKTGTVTEDVTVAIKSVKAGSIEFKVAKDGTIHAGVGKVSFGTADLTKNITAYYHGVTAAKPDDAKGTFIKSVSLASTMGPGIRLNPESITESAK